MTLDWGKLLRSRCLLLALLVCLSFLVRFFTFRFHPVIEGDGVHYASLARNILVQHNPAAGIYAYRASAYPFLIAAIAPSVADVELAGRLISAIFGALLVVPVFALTKRLFTRSVAWLAAILVSIHQSLIYYSATLFTESTFLFFLWAGLGAFGRLIAEKKTAYALMAGSLLAIAAMIHPSGTGYVSILLIILILLFLRAKGKAERIVWARNLLFIIVSFTLVLSLFVVPVWMTTGETPFASKTTINLIGGEDIDAQDPQRTLQRMLSLNESGQDLAINDEARATSPIRYIAEHPVEMIGRIYRNLGKLDRDILLSATRPSQFSGAQSLFIILVVLGIAGVPWRKQDVGHHLYLGAILAYTVLSDALFFFHERLLLPVIPVFLIWGALGIVQLGRWTRALLRGLGNPRLDRWTGKAFTTIGWILALLLLSLFLFNNMRTQVFLQDQTAVHDKEVGQWMRQNLPQEIVLMTDNPFVPFYFFQGEEKYVYVPYENYDRLLGYAQAKSVDYIVVTEWRIAGWNYPSKDSLFGDDQSQGLTTVHEWKFLPGQRAKLLRLPR